VSAKGTPLLAAVSGRITRLRHDLSGLSGNSLTITADDGWSYVYIHLNNDSPGTDDSANRFEYAFAPGMALNKRVAAGELVGFLGDSGNAEQTVAHLHFEIHQPDGAVINAFASLRAASTAPAIPRTW
jgi:murein DD-endopeptidase MepM/ murein hydrolase activator NlpD